LIAGVLNNSPAEHAGLKPGDILVGVDGQQVTDSSSMLNLVSNLKPDTQAVLKIIRVQQEINIPITVGKRPQAQLIRDPFAEE
jgi:serine protease DegQ